MPHVKYHILPTNFSNFFQGLYYFIFTISKMCLSLSLWAHAQILLQEQYIQLCSLVYTFIEV